MSQEEDNSVLTVYIAAFYAVNTYQLAVSSSEQGNPIFLSFDEAHELDIPLEQWTPFSELQRAFRSIRDLSIFSFFLSTTNKMTRFTPPRELDPSNRIQSAELWLIPPFLAYGLDQLAIVCPTPAKFSDIGYRFQAHYGRPLFATRYDAAEKLPDRMRRKKILDHLIQFAASKILGRTVTVGLDIRSDDDKFAVLAQRIPLEFMHTQTLAERNQVENHMRLCLSIDENLHSLRTISSSEPILSEGAEWIMQKSNFNAPQALHAILTGFAIHKGDHGELVRLLMLTMARDIANQKVQSGFFTVVQFLEALFVIPSEQSTDANILDAKPSVCYTEESKAVPLRDAFRNVHMHFNHFIKRAIPNELDFDIIESVFLRNAAVMGANPQPGIDAAIPMVEDTVVIKTATSLFLVQFKNDPKFSATVDSSLFDCMDPVTLGIVAENEVLKVPLIRVVFAMADETPALTFVSNQRKANFVAYDICASGLSSDVYSIIKPEEDLRWKSLLDSTPTWRAPYNARYKRTSDILKTMTPAVANDEPFFAFRKANPPSC